MKFMDKKTATGQPEQYASGESTDRFISIAETREESMAIRASLANVALMAMQSEQMLDPEDAKTLIDFMQIEQHQQDRLSVYPEQAERLARLIRLGGTTVSSDALINQFVIPRMRDETELVVDDETLSRSALDASASITTEVQTRQFRKELDADITIDDILGSTDK